MNHKRVISFLLITGILSAFLVGCAKQRQQYNDYQNVKRAADTVDRATKDE